MPHNMTRFLTEENDLTLRNLDHSSATAITTFSSISLYQKDLKRKKKIRKHKRRVKLNWNPHFHHSQEKQRKICRNP